MYYCALRGYDVYKSANQSARAGPAEYHYITGINKLRSEHE